ncbi:GspE/PulE family protein [bacterium]|nr:GspE/PulE family protein [bacterium]
MKSTRKESSKNKVGLWALEQELGIPSWKNLLSLPESKSKHTEAEIKLEQELKFTFSRQFDSLSDTASVFVSEQTDFPKLCQYLPFLFESFQLHLCADHQIKERLSYLNQDEMFRGDNIATRQLNYLLEYASNRNASDIHIESNPGKKQVRMRIDGKLESVVLEEEIENYLFSKIKLISRMDISIKRKPQDGHFPFINERGSRYDMRTSTVPSINGEKIVIRLLPSTSVRFSLSDLGFSDVHIPVFKKNISAKSGMILFTGPTGSGKTTSLYAILNELASEALNIITIEDPVEYRLENITQVEVNTKADLTFSSALRAFLRQDPDVILVGEIRDNETAQIAARAAQTGHLVLSTLHCNNVFEAIHRLKTLGIEGDDIASSLKLLVSQRLVSLNCACGKKEDCPECSGRGTSGRIPLMEVLEISSSISKLLALNHPISEIETEAVENGFVSIRESGEKLVEKGLISPLELDSLFSK